MPTHTIDVESIERLAEKVRDLIGVLERTRSELSQTVEDNLRVSREVEDLKTQLSNAQSTSSDMAHLMDEREQIRTRVTAMLEQLEGINV
jgi:regulator of replication initiation timing